MTTTCSSCPSAKIGKPPCRLSNSEIDLFKQINRENLKGVRKCLMDQRTRNKININCVNDDNLTPLCVAATEIQNKKVAKSLIRILLKYCAEINFQNSEGETALRRACKHDTSNEVIILLLKKGADPNLTDAMKGTDSPLHQACKNKNFFIAEYLLYYKADVNCIDKDGQTPLMRAIRGDLEAEGIFSQILLEKNALVHLKSDNGETALHFACQEEHTLAVFMILRQGADPDARDNNGCTPLHYACQSTCHESVQMLLEYGANANCKDNYGKTPLHYLVDRFTCVNCVRALLEFNADVNIRNKCGETPLLCAFDVWVADFDVAKLAVVELLLMSGSDVNVQRVKCIESLLDRVCHPRAIGDTPLHGAARYGNVKSAQMILDRNPDLQIVNKNKQTALELSKELQHSEITTCIEEYMYKRRCQMYGFHREMWCRDCTGNSLNNVKSVSNVKRCKRKKCQSSYFRKRLKVCK